MDRRFLIAINSDWIRNDPRNVKHFNERNLLPLGKAFPEIESNCELLLKFRDKDGNLLLEETSQLQNIKESYYLKSALLLGEHAALFSESAFVFILFAGSKSFLRATLHVVEEHDDFFDELELDPTLRLYSYDLPPVSATLVDTPEILTAITRSLAEKDRELYAFKTERFLKSPHILIPLFSQVMDISSRRQLDYLSVLRVIADQFRYKLIPDRIHKVPKDQYAFWESMLGRQVSFVDAGMSRIISLPGTDPTGIRVGVYSVTPGEEDPESRESWDMNSYVVGDIFSPPRQYDDEALSPEPKRLREAGRYVLEVLTLLNSRKKNASSESLFLHGPLINAFQQYDEGQPWYIPALSEEFLGRYDINSEKVKTVISDIPRDQANNLLWNHPMAIYGYLLRNIFCLDVPVAGVVERSGSSLFRNTYLDHLKDTRQITDSLRRKVLKRLDEYRITDEFLFGCILDEGEYIDPLPLAKNLERRAREHWQLVIRQYPKPLCTMLKTHSHHFPFRVETNIASFGDVFRGLMAFLFHTSLLLPGYAFPVGLHIVDTYAKIPDWLSKGISAALSSQILLKALQEGHPRLLEQTRRLLAQDPRDWFFRPQARRERWS